MAAMKIIEWSKLDEAGRSRTLARPALTAADDQAERVGEVEEVVGLGELEPDAVHTPGSYVDRVVKTVSEKRIVSPMPSLRRVPIPATDLMSPPGGGPASVTPR